ncbi:Zinc carboxypeptidase [Peribacillus simplex]|uniref:Zinc carboxypeptidase n=1 Tax=Peribacillus simplex TaxID=1478 RepID=A0A9X8R925_9BACI|nr:M14 family metallocarboxypeptidase [Peribacillus simplex]SIR28195.1 Zinc carboxypeptidase [Peribacillus simplex]
MKKIIPTIVSAAALSLVTGLPGPIAEAEEFTPYYGNGPSYIQPDNLSHLFPDPNVSFNTPAFKQNKIAFTSQEEMLDHLKSLSHKYNNIQFKTIGKSTEGRDIPMLLFSKDSKRPNKASHKPLIWIQGQIHGNEPASGESTLVLAQWLAEGKLGDVLDKVNIAIVPRVNPDGSYYFKRYTANDMDANRDYLKVEYPEVQTIHQSIDDYEPEVILDVHEYTVNPAPLKKVGANGSIASYDLLISSAKNLNIPNQLRKASDELLLPNVFKALKKEKLSYHDYYTLDTSDDGVLTATEGSTEARIGRNALGLKNTMTYLIETRGINIGRTDFKRRVFAQATAQAAFIKTTAEQANKVKKAVKQAETEVVQKGRKANDNDKIVITSENKLVKDQKLTVVDLAKAKMVDASIDWLDSTDAYPTLVRDRPTAYILQPEYKNIAKKLQLLGVEVKQLKKPMKIAVESYRVKDLKVSAVLESGHSTREVTTTVTSTTQDFPKGSYVFDMAQPDANFISLALEPEGIDSYVTFNFIPADKGKELPIYRYMQSSSLPAK